MPNLEDGFDELIEQVDAIDEDLGSLEDDFYEDEDEDDYDYEDDDEELDDEGGSTKLPAPAAATPSV